MDAALIVLDGWGLGDGTSRDAISAARTPTFDRLRTQGAYGTLHVRGRRVGLPAGQMGNSEVGHLNIGAGRIVMQDYTRINDSIRDGTFFTNETLQSTFASAVNDGTTVHFVGLVSDGGVHSSQEHLYALIELAATHGADAVTHAITDGRDTDPTAGKGYLEELESVVADTGTGTVATVLGRYYAMDRDHNWERTRLAFEAIVDRTAAYSADTGTDAVALAYERGETDEFIRPTIIDDRPGIIDGDAVIFFNFRADRSRQLVRMLTDIRPDWAFEIDPPAIHLVTLTEYDETFDIPVAFPPTKLRETLGEVLASNGKTQLRIAETEKYAHVTYFLNGGREGEFPGERRKIIPSPHVPTYDQQPEMSAAAVTDAAIDIIEGTDTDVLVLNYANPDMVGHTGDFQATVEAVEAVDAQLERLVEAVGMAGGHLIVTADHGNADDMGTDDEPHTAHTSNDVPFVYLTPEGTDGGFRVREGGTLADIAPTLLSLIGIRPPKSMSGESLLVRR